MFEYLMPPLFMRELAGHAARRDERAAVDDAGGYGDDARRPVGHLRVGVRRDGRRAHLPATARSACPGSGSSAGLSRRLVVAPYAARSRAADRSARRGRRTCARSSARSCLGALRLLRGRSTSRPSASRAAGASRPSRSYMAHHQGMSSLALGNALCGGAWCGASTPTRRVRAVELLLQERVPRELAPGRARRGGREPAPRHRARPRRRPVDAGRPPQTSPPASHFLANGRYSRHGSPNGGGGYSRWHGASRSPAGRRTRRATAAGLWIYLRDERERRGLVGRPPADRPIAGRAASVVFRPHMAEFHRRDDGIAMRTEMASRPRTTSRSAALTITNESRPRARARADQLRRGRAGAASSTTSAHPAFSKLFVETESLPDLHALLFTRRPRSAAESRRSWACTVVACDDRGVRRRLRDRPAAFLGRPASRGAPRRLRRPARRDTGAGRSIR